MSDQSQPRSRPRRRALVALLASATVVLAACGDSAEEAAETAEDTTSDETTTTSTEPPEPEPAAPTEIVITEPGLYPEGLTYDPVGDRFIIGSLFDGRLLAVDDEGAITEVAERPGANLTGIEADPERDRLLVAVTALPFGNAQLSVHDLATGEQLELVDFATIQPDERRFANGITVDDEGNIYVTDTGAGVIYKVDSTYTPSVFATNDAFEPDRSGVTASGLNGIVAVDGALVVGHAPTGTLFRVPLSDPSAATIVPTGVDGMRIDGLHLSDDGSTLAVVSNHGTVHLFESTDDWSTATEVDRFEVGDVFPTSVTDRDGTFFVLQSHLGELDPRVDSFEIVPVTVG